MLGGGIEMASEVNHVGNNQSVNNMELSAPMTIK